MTTDRAPREILVKAAYGAAIEARAGELVTVTDVSGTQVGDVVAFNLDDRTEWLDMVRTRSTTCMVDGSTNAISSELWFATTRRVARKRKGLNADMMRR